jgi:SLOG cluster3 family
VRLLDSERSGRLGDVVVFLSASIPNREGFEKVPEAPFLIEQAVVSLARAVFSEGGRIIFGAHPSISPLVASVASEYRLAGSPDEIRPVIVYQSEAFTEVLPDETWDMFRFGFADLIWTEARGGEKYRKGDPASRRCPLSLRHMRERMLQETKPRIMVVVGGMEGVFEEVDLFSSLWMQNPELLRDNPKPPPLLYVASSTGGAAARVPEESRFETLKELLTDPASGLPFLHEIERDWEQQTAAAEPREASLNDSGKDPRDVPLPALGAMMQWLVGRIAELSVSQ